MIRFFRKLFKRGDFMTRADKAYYKYRAKTIFWSAFCMIIIAWVGTNLVLCALTTNVTSNFDMIYEAAEPVVLPTGKDFNRMLKKADAFSYYLVDDKIQNLTFDRFTDGVEDKYVVGGVNVLAGAAKETISADNQIYLYRTTDLASVYVLSNNKMQANPDSSWMFSNLSVTSYTFNNFDTSQVQSLNNIFSGIQGILYYANYSFSTISAENDEQQVDVMSWGGGEPIPSSFRPPIEALDLSTWNTSNVTDMGQMFWYCSELATLNVSGWDTRKVTNFEHAFATGQAQDAMPVSNYVLKELDLSSFDTSAIILSYSGSSSDRNYYQMFSYLYGLETVKISDRWTLDNDKIKYTGYDYSQGKSHEINFVVVPYSGK